MPKLKTTQIDNAKLQRLLLTQFRYALRRQTYIVSEACEDLKQHWAIMHRDFRKQIMSDLEHYLTDLTHEHQCDIEDWQKMLDFAKNNLEVEDEAK